jgi:NAD(P)-dependent dehydrogenase (short-subunit alcohol dehydrogenase family)
MTEHALRGTYAVVTGASRGFGRAIAASLIQTGARVVGVARDPRSLAAADLGPDFIPVEGAEEAVRAGLGLRFTCVLPKLTPATDLGAAAVAAYAQRSGVDVATFLASFGPTPTPAGIAADIRTLAADASYDKPAYVLRPTGGLVPLG